MTGFKGLATGAIKLIAPLGIVVGYLAFTQPWVDDYPAVASLDCIFEARADQAPIRLGEYSAPLHSLRLEGDLSDPFEDTLFNFEGTARYKIDGKSITAPVRGSVFLDDSLHPKGLIMTVEDRKFARNDGLSIITLDDEGTLDYSEDLAFAFVRPEFKLSHPMAMGCSTGPPPEARELLDWLTFG
ncbi:hypothetical protein [Alteriqipengyuania lutimaris]|uniref:Uncharacterized protein n=1 Tax=Alteriqipengyuania lutimaris TaxID=1538146 RepID=A0A395LKV6_9SPHN|nr:hypothetical protein [Alteriqipengyuania lutimaris]MBB3033640.1 hypothetical protein [Alteriqipengyuania lutimaris]RDS77365.1 hypothetical protein DL238_06895 [Alteriqipengyuania lutimaris]